MERREKRFYVLQRYDPVDGPIARANSPGARGLPDTDELGNDTVPLNHALLTMEEPIFYDDPNYDSGDDTPVKRVRAPARPPGWVKLVNSWDRKRLRWEENIQGLKKLADAKGKFDTICFPDEACYARGMSVKQHLREKRIWIEKGCSNAHYQRYRTDVPLTDDEAKEGLPAGVPPITIDVTRRMPTPSPPDVEQWGRVMALEPL